MIRSKLKGVSGLSESEATAALELAADGEVSESAE
jgi:hypothetical protein